MKLKELHIRNIASIEKADIDFENDLNDTVTGTPASIFLISGDTGAGKSVILDSISMALYKKTPRIADVANAQRNEYANAEGEQIRVASIEQYTRLGISPKDECYSEVVFEGNDGRTYHARLSLGLKLGNKDKETGVRAVKHNKPVWEIRVDKDDWTKDSVEQTILQAVGLDFQQFGRMAMLAQGQFANFLTGDKKEREAILEQLTNTQHFTEYGEAIQSLYKKAKESLSNIQTEYDTEKTHTLTEEQVEQETKDQQECKNRMDQYDKELKIIEGKQKQLAIIEQNDQALTDAKLEKQKLDARIEGEEYKRCLTLIKDWDETTQQRQQLSTLTKARKEEADAKTAIHALEEKFRLLAADMADKLAKAESMKEEIQRLNDWISSQDSNKKLFTKAGETDLIISQYLDKKAKAERYSTLLVQEQAKTDGLKRTEKEAQKQAEQAEKDVVERQTKIEELSTKRSKLNPQGVNEELKNKNARKQNLTYLLTSIKNLTSIIDQNNGLEAKLKAEEEKLKAAKENNKKADADYQDKKHKADRAAARLTTMQMSLDEKIKELRHLLYKDEAENCPLCGQHINHIHLEDEFKDMLTPLEKDQQQAQESLKKAEGSKDKAIGELKRLEGSYRYIQTIYNGNRKKIDDSQKGINEKAVQLNLDLQKDLTPQVSEAIELLNTSISKLEATQHEAEILQTEINKLIDEKKPFDRKKSEADKTKLRSENAVKANADEIARIEKEHANLISEAETIKNNISDLMSGYNDDWFVNTNALRKQLKEDAKTYTDKKKCLEDSLADQKRNIEIIETLEQNHKEILRLCPAWNSQVVAQPYDCLNINAAWNKLLGDVTSLVSKINECNNLITESEESLTAYYQETGKTEDALYSLMASETQVAKARQLVNDTNAQLRSRTDAIKEAQQLIKVAFNELGIADRSELPVKEELETLKNSCSNQRDDALSKFTQAKTRLEEHQKNIDNLKVIGIRLEDARQKHQRWERLNNIFGGTRFRTLVQSYILRPLLNNANIYLEQITDRYRLTCSKDNEQLSILVLDRYNKDQVRSVTVLSGGERFMISLALSLALSSLNRSDMNIDILFIDEGFGTLDEKSLDSVMATLEKLQEIAGQTNRRVGIISHREELDERIPVKIQVIKRGEGRSMIEISN